MRVATCTGVLSAYIRFRVLADKRSEVTSTLDALVDRMRRVPGCRCGQVFCDINDANSLMLLSEWSDFESASTYFDSHEFHVFRGLRILFRDEPHVVLDEIGARVTKTLRRH